MCVGWEDIREPVDLDVLLVSANTVPYTTFFVELLSHSLISRVFTAFDLNGLNVAGLWLTYIGSLLVVECSFLNVATGAVGLQVGVDISLSASAVNRIDLLSIQSVNVTM